MESSYGIGRLELLRMHAEFLPHLPPRTLLMVLFFLKVYPAEDVGAAAFAVCRNTWRAHVRTGLEQIGLCLPKVIPEILIRNF